MRLSSPRRSSTYSNSETGRNGTEPNRETATSLASPPSARQMPGSELIEVLDGESVTASYDRSYCILQALSSSLELAAAQRPVLRPKSSSQASCAQN
jgi:hypothetical protein